MIKIVDYKEDYANDLSEIILSNMYTINIKDYGKEVIDKLSIHFTEKEIKKNFPKRLRCLVALDDEEVVGTASITNYEGDETGTKFMILTVFVRLDSHHKGIGAMLIKEIEKIAIKIGCKELIIPSSIYGCEFYRKFGFDYLNGKKVLNNEGQYMLSKKYR